jgi:hypothetical protein
MTSITDTGTDQSVRIVPKAFYVMIIHCHFLDQVLLKKMNFTCQDKLEVCGCTFDF